VKEKIHLDKPNEKKQNEKINDASLDEDSSTRQEMYDGKIY
jgi:hypothetical protein